MYRDDDAGSRAKRREDERFVAMIAWGKGTHRALSLSGSGRRAILIAAAQHVSVHLGNPQTLYTESEHCTKGQVRRVKTKRERRASVCTM